MKNESNANLVDDAINTVEKASNEVVSNFDLAFHPVLDWAPNLAIMLLVLGFGYVIARLLSHTMATICEKLGLQVAAERGGLVSSMQQVGIERTVPELIGRITFWFLMCVFIMAACNLLGLQAVSAAMQSLVAYIPKLIVAAVIIVVGLLLASFVRGFVATSADRVGISYAQPLAAACYHILALMVFMAAFEQLEIKFELLSYAILIAFGALAIGFGLAVGLGGRDVMGGILAGYYIRQRLQAGDRIQVAGFEGTVRDVGPVATIIETDDGGLLNRHSVPNVRMLNEAVR